jgi:hypothetical protein
MPKQPDTTEVIKQAVGGPAAGTKTFFLLNGTPAAQSVADDTQPTSHRVFDETEFEPQRPDQTATLAGTHDRLKKASIPFWGAVAIALVEIRIFGKLGATTVVNGAIVIAVIYSVLGILAYFGKKIAFLLGLLLYAGQAVFMLYDWSVNGRFFLLHVLLLKIAIAYWMYRAYGTLSDVELARGEYEDYSRQAKHRTTSAAKSI